MKRIVWRRTGGLCERCKREGFITAGVDCHHIKPVEGAHTVEGPDGMKARAYNPENIELLCVACHIKTHQEMYSHTKEKVAENKARARSRFLEANDPNYQPQKALEAPKVGEYVDFVEVKDDDPNKTPI